VCWQSPKKVIWLTCVPVSLVAKMLYCDRLFWLSALWSAVNAAVQTTARQALPLIAVTQWTRIPQWLWVVLLLTPALCCLLNLRPLQPHTARRVHKLWCQQKGSGNSLVRQVLFQNWWEMIRLVSVVNVQQFASVQNETSNISQCETWSCTRR